MDPENKSIWQRLLRVLPFIIAASYMAAFSAVDSYPYALSYQDDQGLFQRIALNLLNGGAFSGSLSGQRVFCPTRPPLYPFILALTWKITGSMSLLPIRFIQVVCYIVTLYFIAWIGTMVSGGDRKYGMLSALFASLVPFAAAATHVILTESLALFLLTTAVFLATKFRTGTGSASASLVALGGSLGLLILQRPSFIPIPALFLAYVLFSPRTTKRNMVAVLLLMLLPLSAVVVPWTLHARSETGSWSLVRTGVGFNLMQGIVRDSPSLVEKFFEDFRHFQKLDDSGRKEMAGRIDAMLEANKEVPTQAGYFSPEISRTIDYALATYISAWNPRPPTAQRVIKCDRLLKKTAATWIRQYPFRYLRIVSANVVTLLFGDFQPLVYHKIEGYLYLYTAIMKWASWILFIIGTLVLLRLRRFHIVFFPLAVVFYLIIVHWPMHTEPRYFIYAYTFMPMTVPVLLLRHPRLTESGAGGQKDHG